MRFHRTLTLMALAMFIGAFVFSHARPAFGAAGAGDSVAMSAVAVMGEVRGKVLVKRAGAPLWAQAADGMPIGGGDTIKTYGMSGAIVQLPGGVLKINPMAEVTIDSVVEKSQNNSTVLSVTGGGIWLQTDLAEDGPVDRTIVEAAGSVMDITSGNIFLETSESGRVACTDVFSGELNFRTLVKPEDSLNVQKDKRLLFEAGKPVEAPGELDRISDTGDEEYSCLPPSERPGASIIINGVKEDILLIRGEAVVEFAYDEKTRPVVVASETDKELTLLLTGVATVEFAETGVLTQGPAQGSEENVASDILITITKNATVTFSGADEEGQKENTDGAGTLIAGAESCRGAGRDCVVPEDCCSRSCESSVCTEQGDEYDILIVETSGTVTFTCSNAPKIENITVNGHAVAENATFQIAGGECDSSVQAAIAWKVMPVCGSIVAHSISAGDESEVKDGVGSGQSGDFTRTQELVSENVVEVKISAADNFNNIFETSFKLQFKKHENADKPPSVTSVSFDGAAVSAGGSAAVVFENCDGRTLRIAGAAAPGCANVASVSVTRGGAELTVTGQDEWSAEYTTIEEGDSAVSVVATDANGRQSDPFTFTITHKIDEALQTPPQITSVIFDGNEVSSGDAVEKIIEDCEGATLVITGSAVAACSTVSSVAIMRNGNELTVSGQSEWSTQYKVNAEGESIITIVAEDSGGRKGEPFTFNVTRQIDDALLEPPAIVSVMYGDTEISSGDTVTLPFEECGELTPEITGTVSTVCGDLASVVLTKDGTKINVSGLESWSTQDSMSPSDEAASFSLTAMDSGGGESAPFEFTVEPDIESIPLPEVALEQVSGSVVEDLYTPLSFYRDDLESGQLVVRGSAVAEGCSVARVEVSLDGGGDWAEAEGVDSWSYGFEPAEDTYYVSVRAVDSLERETDPTTALELTYSQLSSEDELMDIFDRLIQAYVDKQTSTFMELTSLDFSSDYDGIYDANQLESSLDNKFAAYSNIYLIYSVSSTNVNENYGQVTFRWNANSSVAGYPNYGVFYFTKDPQAGWQFSTVDDANTFLRYTSVSASVAVSAESYTLTADTDETTTVFAAVNDSASNPIADGTEVTFTTSFGTITGSALTADGVAEAVFDAGGVCDTATVKAVSGGITSNTISIVVDQTPATVSLSSDANILVINESDTVVLTAVVRDSSNNLICDGKDVEFFTDFGTFDVDSAVTVDGVVETTFDSTGVCGNTCVSKTVSIYAVSGVNSNTLTIEVRHSVSPDPPGDVVIFASDYSLTQGAVETTTVTAEVRDFANHLVADGTEVEFHTNLGAITAMATTVDGVAMATFDANGALGIATVYAISGIDQSDSIEIEILAP